MSCGAAVAVALTVMLPEGTAARTHPTIAIQTNRTRISFFIQSLPRDHEKKGVKPFNNSFVF
jgi:hypothetical protein